MCGLRREAELEVLEGKVTILKAEKIKRQKSDGMPGSVSGAAGKEAIRALSRKGLESTWRRWGSWG